MTIRDGRPTFHVAPMGIDRRPVYSFDDFDHTAFVHAWRDGNSASPPTDRIVRGPDWPVLIQDTPKEHIVSYEQQLFQKVVADSDITLINPSFKTMSALLPYRGYVSLTSDLDVEWVVRIHDYIKQSAGRLVLLPSSGGFPTVRGVAYLGTNTVTWRPDCLWFRLIVSPFVDHSLLFERYSTEFKDTYVMSRFQKKEDYEVVSTLSRDSPYFVYNPATVDHWLFGSEKKPRNFFFLESSFSMKADPIDHTLVQHSPWFVDYAGEWTTIDDKVWLVNANMVVDVQDGTSSNYLSRRMRNLPPPPYSWSPLLKYGSHWLTYASIVPQNLYGLSTSTFPAGGGVCTALLFENAQPTFGVQKMEAGDGCFFSSSDFPYPYFPLSSKEGLRLYHSCPTLPDTSLAFVWVDNRGQVYHPHSRCDRAVFFSPSPTGRRPVPFLPSGQLIATSSYGTGGLQYVDLSDCDSGVHFVFPDLSDINKMAPSLSLFNTGWHTTKSLFSGMTDPDYGGGLMGDSFCHQVHDFMETVEARSCKDTLPTINQISKTLGISEKLLYHYLSRLPGYIFWRVSCIAQTQFVRADRVLCPSLDKRYTDWSQVLSHVMSARRTSLPFQPFFGKAFVTLLSINGVSCSVKVGPIDSVCTFTRHVK
jgi:hypothetical protein